MTTTNISPVIESNNAHTPDTKDGTSEKQSNWSRRDHLLEIEEKIQKFWAENKTFDIDAPPAQAREMTKEMKKKFFTNFPFPYMNGKFHIGHAFSASKSEFISRFYRLAGYRSIFPFAFHGTGTAITASADRLRREIEEITIDDNKEEEEQHTNEDVTKFISKKAKASSKISQNNSQWNILKSMSIPEDDIPNFMEPEHWLRYFPAQAVEDIKRIGFGIDWRRTFITTDANPFFDAFVQWQFRTLMKNNLIRFGNRPTIFSRMQNQPCTDHDRISGENVLPQEYVLVKLTVQNVPETWKAFIGDKPVALLAATLRPETMFGQTNIFIHPEGQYGFYFGFNKPQNRPNSIEGVFSAVMTREEAEKESDIIYVCSERSAINMGYQGIMPIEVFSDPKKIPTPHMAFSIKGKELFGIPLTAPEAYYKKIYSLPMSTILMDKGTGIVTSVPSDSPDDYATIHDIKRKINYYSEHRGIKPEWVMPYDVIEIIEIPGVSRKFAVDLCIERNVQSPNDSNTLKELKDICYRRGYYEGKMINGPFVGYSVVDAKPLIKQKMVEEGTALVYYESERKVVSRSHEECIVALCDQWYIIYGEENWKNRVLEHINDPKSFTTFSQNTLNQFQHILSWLNEWACSRTYGLGTCIPWEREAGKMILIESLSDSTIYMAYYTIAHYLQGGNLFGRIKGPLGISADQLTDEAFDYIFKITDEMPDTSISPEHLDIMRNEFDYWYPFDVRTSAKDLLFNHLTFCLYNHAAIWKDPKYWPRAIYCNGHILVNSEKMSKSAGNFLTLDDVITRYSADGTRVALADAGDTLEDANFSEATANGAVMRLFMFEQFVYDFFGNKIPTRDGEENIYDSVFINEMINHVDSTYQSYKEMEFRKALKSSFYDFQASKDTYRQLCGVENMHENVIKTFIETQTIILAPVAPHLCEYIWSFVMKKPTQIFDFSWPVFDRAYDYVLKRKFVSVMKAVEDFRRAKDKIVSSRASKSKKYSPDFQSSTNLTKAHIYVATAYHEWQKVVLKCISKLEVVNGNFPDNAISQIKESIKEFNWPNSTVQKALAFARYQMKEEYPTHGDSIFDIENPFDEVQVFSDFEQYISRSLGISDIEIIKVNPMNDETNYPECSPGIPTVIFS